MKFILSGAFKSGSRKMSISRTTVCGLQAIALTCAVLVCGITTVRAGVLDGRGGSATNPHELRLAACQKYIEGEYDEARDYYQQAIESAEKTYGQKSSFVADLYYEAGSLSLEDGNFPKADRFLSTAVKRKPNSTMARVKYAELLGMQGQTGEALEQINEALKRNPGAPEAQQAMVKWMMTKAAQCDPRTKEGAKASLYSTIEGYKLSNMGRSAAENAHARIARWGDKKLPPVQIESTVAVATPPAATSALDLLKSVINPGKAEAEKPAEPPKVEAKQPEPPKPRKVIAVRPKPPKPKAKAKPQEQAKPKQHHQRPSESVAGIPPPPPMSFGVTPIASSKKGKGSLLVPPPPPLMPVFSSAPPPPSDFSMQLKTKAKITSETTKEPEVRKSSKPKPQVVDGENFDDVLDWAGVEKKKKPKLLP